MSTGKGHFYSIQFKTSQGQLSPAYGGTSRNWNYKYQVPPGKEIKAFYGTYGNEIFGIGFYVGPTPTPAPACKASQITGKWEYLTTVGVPEDWTTFYGTTKTESQSPAWLPTARPTVIQNSLAPSNRNNGLCILTRLTSGNLFGSLSSTPLIRVRMC